MAKPKIVNWLLENASYQGNDCLRWPFNTASGYGTFMTGSKMHYAHRYMCQLVNGPPPTDKHQAAHSCGNGHLRCVTPAHLSWKTRSENQNDRAIHGTKNIWGGRGKLTPEKAEQIKLLSDYITQVEIAAMMGVSRSQVSWVVTGKAWTKTKVRKWFSPEELTALNSQITSRKIKDLAAEYGCSTKPLYKMRAKIRQSKG